MKHFPGYGDNEDTHTGIAVDEREYSYFENADFTFICANNAISIAGNTKTRYVISNP